MQGIDLGLRDCLWKRSKRVVSLKQYRMHYNIQTDCLLLAIVAIMG
jgi:hypothetical protein